MGKLQHLGLDGTRVTNGSEAREFQTASYSSVVKIVAVAAPD